MRINENWQPIETAPRDGTRFLAIARDGVHGIVSIIHRHDPGRRYECWVTDFNSPCGLAPIYWMPLPGLPTDDDGEKI
jgi:hypothetical protein